MTLPDDATVLERFIAWETARRHHTYLTQPGPDGSVVDYSWGEVGDQARRAAAYLVSLGLPRGSRIALLGRNSAHWIVADLAIMMAGMVSVPLYPAFSAESVRYVLGHSEAKLLLLGKLDGIHDNWANIRESVPADLPQAALPLSPRRDLLQWSEILAAHAPLADVQLPALDEPATIVYTSGTTGQPKGVVLSHGSLAAAYLSMLRSGHWDTRQTARGFSYLPLAHAAERAAVEVASLAFGYRVFFADSLATFVDDLKRARPTVFFSVPRLWTKFHLGINEKIAPRTQRWLFAVPVVGRIVKRRILRELGLDQVRLAFTSSAPLPDSLMRWYRDLGLELLDVYGMTENFAISHANLPGCPRLGSVGRPQVGVAARIGAGGEIEVKSPTQMLGYYKEPELTARLMTADGYFRTGDCGEIDADGFLRITGRIKDAFKTLKGEYVAPAPIEQQLATHPLLEAVCVAGAGLAMPFALLMLSVDTRMAVAAGRLDRAVLTREFAVLRERVNAGASAHERLQFLVIVKDTWTAENALLTPTLKIRRGAIEGRYAQCAGEWAALGQPVVWET
ncbi:AMP-binding acetyl-CoA synthetase [Burkholderia sp. A9]|uniref:AMP-binding protein n=1 Tax=Burkholderia sp. A9 TaxID=1365108 RepID=UPI000573EE78|nr:AMP-binding protein [Burkholderia sp. A9]KHK56508.1 AMP-binding acetyl-CoA synthetase [Burkholderia sp. A9]